LLADASNKLTDPDEDEQAPAAPRRIKALHEALGFHRTGLVTENFAEAGPTVALPGHAGLIGC
jgi:hypothetical protein